MQVFGSTGCCKRNRFRSFFCWIAFPLSFIYPSFLPFSFPPFLPPPFLHLQLPLQGHISSFHSGHAFCYAGVLPISLEGLTKLWTDVRITVDITPDNGLIITRGNSSKSALAAEETKSHLWNGSRIVRLSPYGVSCIALVPSGLPEEETITYKFNARVAPMYRHLLLFVAGLVLLMAAPQLSRSGQHTLSLPLPSSHHHLPLHVQFPLLILSYSLLHLITFLPLWPLPPSGV